MKANELRIGNYVDNDRTVISINSFECELSNLYRRDYMVRTEDLIPIKLTEKWLIKFGFYYYKDMNKYKIYLKYSADKIRINIDNNNSFWIYTYNGTIPLNYVHELQNIYFALTKSDLTYKIEI